MREAKRLQAAATAKYDQAEALLAQYGLADVPPCAAAAPEGRGGYSSGRVRAMSAYQSNVKVEPPCVARSARTPGSIVASSTIQGNIAASFNPMLPHGGLFNEQPAAAGCDGRSPHGLQSVASSEAGSRGAAPLPLGY